MTNRCVARH